jgi:uncharacterized membrane protein YbhN (UPF0104 family)
MKRIRSFIWPAIALAAIVWSVRLLYRKLLAEVSVDPGVKAQLGHGVWSDLKTIMIVIFERLAEIPPRAYLLCLVSTLFAYWALAWYDRIALRYLGRDKSISWLYVAVTSFVTYALSHNIGASVFSGGMVRFRAYTAKGLSPQEIAVLVAICSFTFAFGTILLTGIVLLYEPQILKPLADLSPFLARRSDVVMFGRLVGVVCLAFVALYVIGSILHFRPLRIGSFQIVYPRPDIVARQIVAGPLELMGAAGIIYFAMPDHHATTFMLVLGAFLLSFSAGLLSQVPGGVGVMEAVFLAIMPGVAPTAVVAALLVWRLCYLIAPLIMSLPVIVAFEHSQLGRAMDAAPTPDDVN